MSAPVEASKSKRLLLDLAARLPDGDLPLDLGLDPARDEAERVDVLDLGARAEPSSPSGRTETLASTAERALLHLGVGDPELDDRLAQQLEEAPRLLGGVDVGLRDDLDERCAAAVEVDDRVARATDPARRAAVVNRLGGVLLEVGADDAAPRGRRLQSALSTLPSMQSGRSYCEI